MDKVPAKEKKILLIRLPMIIHRKQKLAQYIPEPLGLMYLKSYSKKHSFDVDIYDSPAFSTLKYLRIDEEDQVVWGDLPDLNTLKRYGVIGISCLYANQRAVLRKFFDLVHDKLPNTTLVAGGSDVSADFYGFHKEFDSFDYYVLGEGEHAWVEVLQHAYMQGDLRKCWMPLRNDLIESSQKYPLLIKNDRQQLMIKSCSYIGDIECPFRNSELMDAAFVRSVSASVAAYLIGKGISETEHIVERMNSFIESKAKCDRWAHYHRGKSAGTKDLVTAHVQFSRGCPNFCHFCVAHRVMGRRIKYREPGSVCEEVLSLEKDFNVRHFNVVDDNFACRMNHAVEILEALPRNKNRIVSFISGLSIRNINRRFVRLLKDKGVKIVELGIETVDPKLQKAINKQQSRREIKEVIDWCHREGMYVIGYFLIGIPGQTSQGMREALEIPRELNLDSARFFPVKAFKGSKLTSWAEKHYRIRSVSGDSLHLGYIVPYEVEINDIMNIHRLSRELYPETDWAARENFGIPSMLAEKERGRIDGIQKNR